MLGILLCSFRTDDRCEEFWIGGRDEDDWLLVMLTMKLILFSTDRDLLGPIN